MTTSRLNSRPWRIGIDLGGSKIEVAILDDTGAIRLRRRVATPSDAHGRAYIETVAAIAALVVGAETETAALRTEATCTVGVGIPGTISPASGVVKNANSTWLNGQRLCEDLQDALERPVRIQNDANCLALSEATDGAASGANCVFAAILGTGVGAGICIDGRPLVGRHSIAGEWGHNPLPHADVRTVAGGVSSAHPGTDRGFDPRCWCGRHGCIEAWLSGPALAADYRRHGFGSAAFDRANAQIDTAPIDAATIIRLADGGDHAARCAFERYLDRLARALGTVVNLLDPDVIVLGGGLSNAATLYRELPLRLPAYVFSDRCDTPIRPAHHGDSSGVRGAAWLWPVA